MDEADALSDADLLVLRQLGGQAGLTGRGVVHGHVSLLLVGTGKKHQHTNSETTTTPMMHHCVYKVSREEDIDVLKRPVNDDDYKKNTFVYSGVTGRN